VTNSKESYRGLGRRALNAVAPTLLILGGIPTQMMAGAATAQANGEKQAMTTQSKFYCNIKALTPSERSEHKRLTDKLVMVRKRIVETDKGYEFQFDPSDISLSELSRWATAEGKCCPFFDFHIDLERAGSLLCLRLAGEDEIKSFIRSEFQVPAK
jgi:hypothetical protein